MKIKLPLLISIFWLGFHNNAQDFPYLKEWGSYVGGTGTLLYDYFYDGNSFFTDSDKNIYVNGTTSFQNGYSASYYSQFVLAGNHPNIGYPSGQYTSKFSNSGQMLFGSYTNNSGAGGVNNWNDLVGIDSGNNKYYLKRQSGIIPNLSTPGAWLSQNTNPSFNTTFTLSKYDASQNLLWTTYLPDNEGSLSFIRTDENQNVYLVGHVEEQVSGLASNGVFQENYINYLGSSTLDNSYIVKLNSSGGRIWGTYSVIGIQDLELYDGGLYTLGEYNSNIPGTFTTPGTFQPNTSTQQILLKFDANNGQKVWGTYYGTILNGYEGSGIYDLEVNETGMYVSGQSESVNLPTYYATQGAFKSQLTGGGDLFLSKFNHDGNRIWSTYFGSDGYDYIHGSPNLSILGNRIIITGNQVGASNNISTSGAYLSSIPANSASSMFFAEFDSNGSRKWCSYFGGSNQNSVEEINPAFLSDGSLILWGGTTTSTGIGTPGAAFPTMINPSPGNTFGFIAKFTLKESELSTSDVDKNNDLKLYNNPNNGHFYISGSILEKQNITLKIFDSSGRLLKQLNLNKNKTQEFNLQNELSKGNYLLELNSEKGEKIKIFKMSVK